MNSIVGVKKNHNFEISGILMGTKKLRNATKDSDLVQGNLIIRPVGLVIDHPLLHLVVPLSGWNVDFAVIIVHVQHRGHHEIISHQELIVHLPTVDIGAVEVPQRPDDWVARSGGFFPEFHEEVSVLGT